MTGPSGISLFDDIIALDPAVVLDYGDPQSLLPAKRIRALEVYVERYGRGGWRGLSTPRIQVHRFASQDLMDSVKLLWDRGIENREVRELLLEIIATGKLGGCADIAYAIAMDVAQTVRERGLAIDALLQLNDPRLETLSVSVETDAAGWPEAIAGQAVHYLFPTHMPVTRLSQILRRVKEKSRSRDDLSHRLSLDIEMADISLEYLDQLRQALTELIIDAIAWERDRFPYVQTRRPDLMAALIAACRRQAAEGVRNEPWITSSLLAVRLSDEDYSDKDTLTELRGALAELPADMREIAFWKEDEFLGSLHQPKDAWHRVYDLSNFGGIQLNDEKDAAWIRKRLSDPNEPLEHREMMLWAEMVLLDQTTTDHRELLTSLKPFVSDAPCLTTIIDDRLNSQEASARLRQMKAEIATRTEQAKMRTAKAHASWVKFWGEIAEDPEGSFATDRAENTAWNLWKAVERSGQESRS